MMSLDFITQLGMMNFLWPWVFILLPLPLIFRLILPRAKQTSEAALRVPYLEDFDMGFHEQSPSKAKRWPLLLYTLAWLCLITAAARPQWTGDAIELPISGRDLLLAVDLSKSMEQPIRYKLRSVSRISATKAVVSRFIERRVGDRIGLILFGEQAYVQAPLTFDRTTVNVLLEEAATGLAGNATAIGDAIGLAVKRLQETDKQASNIKSVTTNENNKNHDDRVLILVTDGVSNAGEIKPIKAAELAARRGLKIYTIGIGNRGSRELDEKTLKAIAKKTGGRYFRASNTDELNEIYNILDKLEPVEKDTQSYRPTKSLFYFPLAAAMFLAALLALMLNFRHLSSMIGPRSIRTAPIETRRERS